MRTVAVTTHDACHAEVYHFVTEANAAQTSLRLKRVLLPVERRSVFAAATIEADAGCEAARACKPSLKLAEQDALLVLVDANVYDSEDDEYFISHGEAPATDGQAGAALVSLYYLRPESTFMREAGQWWKELPEYARKRIRSDSVINLLLSAVAMEVGVAYHDDCRGCPMDYCQSPTDLVASLKGGFTFCEDCQKRLAEIPEGDALGDIARWLTSHPFRVRQLATGEFDVFLCHHEPDKPAVRKVAAQLRNRGIVPWLDEEQLRPGFPWKRALGDAIEKIRSAAIFIGASGVGPWQDREIDAFLEAFVERNCPVIPVLLADVPPQTPAVPVFLRGMKWVDFRTATPDPFEQLVWGITGDSPQIV